jgi:hypothetical protein
LYSGSGGGAGRAENDRRVAEGLAVAGQPFGADGAQAHDRLEDHERVAVIAGDEDVMIEHALAGHFRELRAA